MEKKVSKRLARLHLKWPAQPNSIVLSLNRRSQNGFEPHLCKHLVDCFSNRRIPYLWKEHEFQLGELNKVFASQWISDDSVVMGTKCNKVFQLWRKLSYYWKGHILLYICMIEFGRCFNMDKCFCECFVLKVDVLKGCVCC